MDLIAEVDTIACCYPILGEMTVNGVKMKFLQNFNQLYEWVSNLGRGAYGNVRCYREIATGIQYALKEIPITLETNIHSLQEEVAILAKLSIVRPSIVKYRDSFVCYRDRTLHYIIVMDYIVGCTVHQYISSLLPLGRKVPPSTAYGLIIWLLDELAMIHAAGYIHRDVKPDNIMIDRVHRRFVLIDFGLSCSKSNRERIHRIAGTPEFISPEQWVSVQPNLRTVAGRTKGVSKSAKLSLHQKADIWAAGITLYCLLEGKYPWANASNTAEETAALGIEVVSPRSFHYTYPHSDLIEAVQFILQRDPNRRPTAVEACNFVKRLHRENPPAAFSSLGLSHLLTAKFLDPEEVSTESSSESSTETSEVLVTPRSYLEKEPPFPEIARVSNRPQFRSHPNLPSEISISEPRVDVRERSQSLSGPDDILGTELPRFQLDDILGSRMEHSPPSLRKLSDHPPTDGRILSRAISVKKFSPRTFFRRG